MSKPSIPKGTRDFGAEEMRRRNYIFETIRSVFALYGFEQIETPAMEPLLRSLPQRWQLAFVIVGYATI